MPEGRFIHPTTLTTPSAPGPVDKLGPEVLVDVVEVVEFMEVVEPIVVEELGEAPLADTTALAWAGEMDVVADEELLDPGTTSSPKASGVLSMKAMAGPATF